MQQADAPCKVYGCVVRIEWWVLRVLHHRPQIRITTLNLLLALEVFRTHTLQIQPWPTRARIVPPGSLFFPYLQTRRYAPVAAARPPAQMADRIAQKGQLRNRLSQIVLTCTCILMPLYLHRVSKAKPGIHLRCGHYLQRRKMLAWDVLDYTFRSGLWWLVC